MKHLRIIGILFLLAGILAVQPTSAQETLRASRVEARGGRQRLPALGLPRRADRTADAYVRYYPPQWQGAISASDAPHWVMLQAEKDMPWPSVLPLSIRQFCNDWASARPAGKLSLVYGPMKGGMFVVVCKQTRGSLGWKSLGFIAPPEGIPDGANAYRYSTSVNHIEHLLGYDFFPKLPSYLQEIIEEMTAAELLCSFQESDFVDPEGPDTERDDDWEEDQRDMG